MRLILSGIVCPWGKVAMTGFARVSAELHRMSRGIE
jgi:hypothetical protein